MDMIKRIPSVYKDRILTEIRMRDNLDDYMYDDIARYLKMTSLSSYSNYDFSIFDDYNDDYARIAPLIYLLTFHEAAVGVDEISKRIADEIKTTLDEKLLEGKFLESVKHVGSVYDTVELDSNPMDPIYSRGPSEGTQVLRAAIRKEMEATSDYENFLEVSDFSAEEKEKILEVLNDEKDHIVIFTKMLEARVAVEYDGYGED